MPNLLAPVANSHVITIGRDCMDNVCRRVNLQQPDLFGLKFYSRRPYPKYRWVDLDRPLKKQLDKYAQQPSGPLHLGVMFYVHDVSLLEDEVTRFHYFMQLKYDVLDGKLRCVSHYLGMHKNNEASFFFLFADATTSKQLFWLAIRCKPSLEIMIWSDIPWRTCKTCLFFPKP